MADLNIIGSGGVQVGGVGIISRWTTPTSFVGSGGVKVSGTGIVTFSKPGVLIVIGTGGVEVGGEGVIAFSTPPVLSIIGSGGVKVDGRGIINFISPLILSVIGSGGVKVGGQGIITFSLPVVAPVFSIVGSGGIVVGGVGVITFSVPPVLTIIGSGGVKVGGFRVPELTVVNFVSPATRTLTIIGSGGAEVGGAGVIVWSKPPIFTVPVPLTAEAANVVVGGAGIIAFIHPQILQIIGEGGVTVEAEPTSDEVYETWVVVGARGEPSLYSGFNFNSYATYRGKDYGAGMEGIYLLEGDTDAGESIHPGVRIGPINFGTDREKRLRLLRCGGKTTGAQVKVSNGNGSTGYYDVEGGRAAVSREIQGRELTIDITDFESLDHLEIVPLVLHKR